MDLLLNLFFSYLKFRTMKYFVVLRKNFIIVDRNNLVLKRIGYNLNNCSQRIFAYSCRD